MRQLVIVAILIVAMSAFGQDSSSQSTRPDNQDDAVVQTAQLKDQDGAPQALTWHSPLVIVQCLWMALIAIGAPLYSKCAAPKNNKEELRGLNLPRGSIRGILALLAVGSFVNVLVLGGPALGKHFDSILAAFRTLTGAMTGFYFANRSATTHPNQISKTEP